MIYFLKLTLAPALVALASLAGRRWGLKVGGLFGGFPVVVGPILFFFAVEQGSDFAAMAALKSLWSCLPYGIYCLALSWACLRLPLAVSVLISWIAFLAISYAGLNSQAGLGATALIAIISTLIASLALPKLPKQKAVPVPPSRWDLPLRMLATLILLLSVTASARALGPQWSGALASFPVASTVLAAFAFLSDGRHGPAALFKGSLLGCVSFGTFCGLLAYALPIMALAPAFVLALSASIGVQIALLLFMNKKTF